MENDTHERDTRPVPETGDALTAVLRQGARDLLRQAVEAELQAFLDEYAQHKLNDGRQAVVRNGYQPERTVQTGIGEVPVRVPKTRGPLGLGHPLHIQRAAAVFAPQPLGGGAVAMALSQGVSSGDFQEALTALLGEQAEGLSASTLGRLKQQWLLEHDAWRERNLSGQRYLYWWADGIHFNLRGDDDDRACLLVIIGVLPDGTKEFVAIDDGMRESTQSWYELLVRLRDTQGLTNAPRLAIGDGALGFWKALEQAWPGTPGQRCWVHKTANVLNRLPKRVQPKAKSALQAIWMAENREQAEQAFDTFLTTWGEKYPKAAETLNKDRDALLTFYDFPASHWQSIRTTNPIESTFATVRLRTAKTRGCLTRDTILSLTFKLGQSAQKRWRRLRGYQWLYELQRGVRFIDGVAQYTESDHHRSAA